MNVFKLSLLIGTIFATPVQRALAADVLARWVGGSGDWTNAANWDIGQVPNNAGGTTYPFAMPEGMRMRLKPGIDLAARFPLTGTPGSAAYKGSQMGHIVMRALQKYGMLCADGQNSPNIFISGERDAHTQRKWADFGGTSQAMYCVLNYMYQTADPLTYDDFEIVSPTWQFAQYQNYQHRK
jgi:hypothetical protein